MTSKIDSIQNYIEIGLFAICGTISTLITKFQYETKSNGFPDSKGNTLRNFEFSWFQTLIMFIGEFYCLPLFYAFKLYQKYRGTNSKGEEFQPNLSSDQEKDPNITKPSYFLQKYCRFLVAGSAMLDLIGTGMWMAGLLYLDASIGSMLNGCTIIFTGLLSWWLLKVKLNRNMLLGIASATAGVILMGIGMIVKTNIHKYHDHNTVSSWKVIIGLCLVVGSLLFQAFQMVFDQKILNGTDISEIENVGLQGLYGSIMAIFVLIVCYYIPGNAVPLNNYENVLDALKMLSNNHYLIMSIISFSFIIMAINILGQRITKKLSATFRSVVNNIRGLLIWIVEIFIFYVFKNKIYGQPLNLFSLFKVAGYILIITGAVFYKIPVKEK